MPLLIYQDSRSKIKQRSSTTRQWEPGFCELQNSQQLVSFCACQTIMTEINVLSALIIKLRCSDTRISHASPATDKIHNLVQYFLSRPRSRVGYPEASEDIQGLITSALGRWRLIEPLLLLRREDDWSERCNTLATDIFRRSEILILAGYPR